MHYTFNLRDFAKIIFGVLLMKKGECDGVARHVRLWVHGIWRVIGDRLVVNEDRMWMLEQVRGVIKNTFGQGFDEVMKHLDNDADGKVTTLDEIRTLIFGDMLSQPAAPNRPYTECADIPTLQTTVESHLEQYNRMSTKKMDLVCFLYMLEHLSLGFSLQSGMLGRLASASSRPSSTAALSTGTRSGLQMLWWPWLSASWGKWRWRMLLDTAAWKCVPCSTRRPQN